MYYGICIEAYHRVSYERLKLSKDGLNHFLLVVMSRISP